MTFVTTKHYHSDSEAVYGYQYPDSHPLIKGHFPGNPVMMGVCQWLMLEDAMSHYFSEAFEDGSQQLTCNAQILKLTTPRFAILNWPQLLVILLATTGTFIHRQLKKSCSNNAYYPTISFTFTSRTFQTLNKTITNQITKRPHNYEAF